MAKLRERSKIQEATISVSSATNTRTPGTDSLHGLSIHRTLSNIQPLTSPRSSPYLVSNHHFSPGQEICQVSLHHPLVPGEQEGLGLSTSTSPTSHSYSPTKCWCTENTHIPTHGQQVWLSTHDILKPFHSPVSPLPTEPADEPPLRRYSRMELSMACGRSCNLCIAAGFSSTS